MANILEFPTTGVLPGLELVVNLNTALQLLATNNASSTAPIDPFLYQLWYNTATGQLTQWNGTEWVPTTFGAPLSSVNIISGGVTVTVDNLGTILEAQGATSYTIALPDPADFPSGNVAVFNNTTGGNNITVTTASGNFIGVGVTGASVLLPQGFFALFISDGFNWVVNSTLGNALLNGSANQVFNVAKAVQASNAVPLSQAQALFAALNGNTANAFAVANAPSANYAINLGQANSLYAQLAQSNTFEGVQNFASGVTTVAGAGGVSAGTLPSGANGFVQANLPATFSGFFEQYYKGGTLVYSIDSSGNITANSLTAPTLDITGTATVPTAAAPTSALQLQQVTNSTLNAAFANIQATGNVNGVTISGSTVSGSTVAGGSGSFNSLSAQTTSINALSALNASLTNINATSIYGQTVSGGTAAFTSLTVSGSQVAIPSNPAGYTWAGPQSGPNPPQFDNTQKFATTEWILNNGITFNSQIIIEKDTTLDISACGKWVICNSGVPITLTLPLTSDAPPFQASLLIFNNLGGAPVTIVQQASDSQPVGSVSNILHSNRFMWLTNNPGGRAWQTFGQNNNVPYEVSVAGVPFVNATAASTLTGTTAGSIVSSQPQQGAYKMFAAQAIGYENDSTTAQTITFPTAFSNTPVITQNTTGLTLSVSTTKLTITAPNNTTTYNGLIKVEGF